MVAPLPPPPKNSRHVDRHFQAPRSPNHGLTLCPWALVRAPDAATVWARCSLARSCPPRATGCCDMPSRHLSPAEMRSCPGALRTRNKLTLYRHAFGGDRHTHCVRGAASSATDTRLQWEAAVCGAMCATCIMQGGTHDGGGPFIGAGTDVGRMWATSLLVLRRTSPSPAHGPGLLLRRCSPPSTCRRRRCGPETPKP